MMDRARLNADLEAYALDLLDADVAEEFERSLAAHPDIRQRAAGLHQALAALGGPVGFDHPQAPDVLRTRMVDAAFERRAAGTGSDGVRPAPAVTLYREVVTDVAALLDELSSAEMEANTIYDIPVVELVSHLSAMEAYMGDRSGIEATAIDPSNHVAMRDPGADLGDPPTVVLRWRRKAEAVLQRVTGLTEEERLAAVDFHGFSVSIDDMLVGRGFEMWTHGEDICRATGRPLRPPSGPVLRTMAEGGVRLLQLLTSVDGTHQGKSIRLTLTGSGGGSWGWTLGGGLESIHPAGPSDATLVVDVVEFCRLLAARVQPGLLESHSLGDRGLVADLIELAPSQADYGAGPVVS